MTVIDIISLVVSILTTIVVPLLAWSLTRVKTYIRQEVRSHLVPNGGGSLADRITALEGAVQKIKETLECSTPGCPAHSGCAHTQTAARRRGPFGLFG